MNNRKVLTPEQTLKNRVVKYNNSVRREQFKEYLDETFNEMSRNEIELILMEKKYEITFIVEYVSPHEGYKAERLTYHILDYDNNRYRLRKCEDISKTYTRTLSTEDEQKYLEWYNKRYKR